MPTPPVPSDAEPGLDATPSEGQRFTQALVALTRAIWHPDCSFDSALALICEIAADALRVERVNVWHYDRDARRLRCIEHMYGRGPNGNQLSTPEAQFSLGAGSFHRPDP